MPPRLRDTRTISLVVKEKKTKEEDHDRIIRLKKNLPTKDDSKFYDFHFIQYTGIENERKIWSTMNFERIKKRGPVSKEYVGQKSAGKGVRHAFYSFLRSTFFLFYTVLYRIKLGQTF